MWQCVLLISVLVRLRLDPVSKKNQTKTLVYILSVTVESKFAPILSVSLEQEDKVWKTNLFRKVWEKIKRNKLYSNRADKMAQQVNVFAILDVNLILIFKMKKQTPEIVL